MPEIFCADRWLWPEALKRALAATSGPAISVAEICIQAVFKNQSPTPIRPCRAFVTK